MRKKVNKKEIIFSTFIIVLILILLMMPDLYQSPYGRNVQRAKAWIVSVDNSQLEYCGVITAGVQSMQAEILNTEHKGQVVNATNTLLGNSHRQFTIGNSPT